MDRREYPLIPQKKGVFGYAVSVLLLLFFAAGIVASISNVIYDFSFTSIVVGLIMIAVCVGLGYVVVKSFYNKKVPTLVVDDAGVTPLNMTLVKNTLLKWQDINKVEVNYNEHAKVKILQILPKDAGPVFVSENQTKDFGTLVLDVATRFDNARQAARAPSQQPAYASAPTPPQAGGDSIALAHQRAVEWWEQTGQEEAICDGCNRPLSRGNGFLVGSYLYCHSCVPK